MKNGYIIKEKQTVKYGRNKFLEISVKEIRENGKEKLKIICLSKGAIDDNGRKNYLQKSVAIPFSSEIGVQIIAALNECIKVFA